MVLLLQTATLSYKYNHPKPSFMQIIKVPSNRSICFVAAEQIIRVEHLSNYSSIHFTTSQ